MQKEGISLSVNAASEYTEKAYALLKADAANILKLIEVQMENLTMPQCPLYEEVLDTQMFGLSREIDFAIRLQLIDEDTGKQLLSELERKLAELHEASMRK
ncbi:YlaN family protein [Anaerobacillus sp. MEB173]|uniref:YlaN family protein n=1 Tax=Anaerobacillus sp. MEB173 TaxID=3383345 RepID=UPI003F90B300